MLEAFVRPPDVDSVNYWWRKTLVTFSSSQPHGCQAVQITRKQRNFYQVVDDYLKIDVLRKMRWAILRGTVWFCVGLQPNTQKRGNFTLNFQSLWRFQLTFEHLSWSPKFLLEKIIVMYFYKIWFIIIEYANMLFFFSVTDIMLLYLFDLLGT